MAGNYADVPGPRISYDKNGTVMLKLNNLAVPSSIVTTYNASEIGGMANDGTTGTQNTASSWLCFVFPHLFDLVGIGLFSQHDTAPSPAEWSSDTTNGIDGTWTVVTVNRYDDNGDDPLGFRNGIRTVSLTGVKGWRVRCTGSFDPMVSGVHFYGTPSSGENPDRLALWHPTTDNPITDGAYFDWDDIPQGSSQTKTFRIKNLSSTLTANTVTIGKEDTRTGISPTMVSQFTFDVAGGGYNPTASLGNLAAGAISGLVTIKYDVSSSAMVSLMFSRLLVEAASWA